MDVLGYSYPDLSSPKFIKSTSVLGSLSPIFRRYGRSRLSNPSMKGSGVLGLRSRRELGRSRLYLRLQKVRVFSASALVKSSGILDSNSAQHKAQVFSAFILTQSSGVLGSASALAA